MIRRGDHAQLLQHAELVKEAPRLDDLSILNVEHGQIPLLKSFLEEAADDRFVGFGLHGLLLSGVRHD